MIIETLKNNKNAKNELLNIFKTYENKIIDCRMHLFNLRDMHDYFDAFDGSGPIDNFDEFEKTIDILCDKLHQIYTIEFEIHEHHLSHCAECDVDTFDDQLTLHIKIHCSIDTLFD